MCGNEVACTCLNSLLRQAPSIYYSQLTADTASRAKLWNDGVPNPVTGSHPSVAFQPAPGTNALPKSEFGVP